MIYNVEYCFIYLFVLCITSQVSDPFSNRVLFLLLSFKSSFYVLDNSPFSDTPFADIFSQSGLFYHFLEN